MTNFIKSLFKPTTVQVSSIQDLFPYFDPDKFMIGYKQGTLNMYNKDRMLNGESFEFMGHPSDFVILPKSTTNMTVQETTNER